MVADELLDRLRTINAAAVYDEDLPERFTPGRVPILSLHHISAVANATVDGKVYATTERWQVSVRGSDLHAVRVMVHAVSASLHGFTSLSIARCDYESWPGTRRESTAPLVYHAPVDFKIFSHY